MTGRSAGRPVFLAAYLEPTLGMERVATSVIDVMAETADVDVIVGQGATWSRDGVTMTSLGPAVHGPRRLAALLWRFGRVRRQLAGRTVVVVGVWAAIPWLVVAPRSSRTIVWEHSLIREKRESARGLRILALGARVLYRRASAIVCVSESLAEDVKQLTGHAQVVVISNPIAAEYLSPAELAEGVDTASRQLITVGSLTNTKNQASIIRALPLLPESQLDVVGDGPMRGALEELAGEAGVADRVHFHGHQGADRVVELLRSAELMVHAAVGETFGLVYFEAAQAGLPVLAHRNRIAEEFIPRYVPGAVYDGSADDLVAAVTARRASPRAEDVEAAAQARRSTFDRVPIAAQWSELLSGHQSSTSQESA